MSSASKNPIKQIVGLFQQDTSYEHKYEAIHDLIVTLELRDAVRVLKWFDSLVEDIPFLPNDNQLDTTTAKLVIGQWVLERYIPSTEALISHRHVTKELVEYLLNCNRFYEVDWELLMENKDDFEDWKLKLVVDAQEKLEASNKDK